ncbi:type IV pilin protein [Variovorax rhizosphaerae]|uniref:Type IV pilin protein n=1 Tax=Variovorax rhizosphaerae TaxID=1836200 RepID=A0ABU8WHE7_9BURK
MIKATFSCQAGPVSRRKHVRGFTLIELMIVVAVIGILSAIAYPSYQSYILKSRRADAKNALLELAAREERVFSNTNAYSLDPVELGYGPAGTTWPLDISSSGSASYQLTVAADATGYVAKAKPKAGTPQTADRDCLEFRIKADGSKSNYDLANNELTLANCW